MMTRIHRVAVWFALLGVVLGWLLTAFVFYPPYPGWFAKDRWGDVATWVAGLATFLAAVIALYSAREAILIAKMPLDADARSKAVRARILAKALGAEFLDAKAEIDGFAEALDQACESTYPRLRQLLARGFLTALSTTQRALDHCESFGENEGPVIADVSAEIINLRQRAATYPSLLAAWEAPRFAAPRENVTNDDIKIMRKLAARARECNARVDAAMGILEKHGYRSGPERV